MSGSVSFGRQQRVDFGRFHIPEVANRLNRPPLATRHNEDVRWRVHPQPVSHAGFAAGV